MQNPSCTDFKQNLQVSAIVPAHNECASIARVVSGLLALRNSAGGALIHEVIVADNGSTDTTSRVAAGAGARVIQVPRLGYGQACWDAVQASISGRLVFVDGDGAVDPRDVVTVLDALDNGCDMVIGVRTHVEPGSMSIAQRMGNALACQLMRLLWQMPAHDLGPLRAIRREAFDSLDMQDRAFGWTVEMQVRAHVLSQRVSEVPVRWLVRTAGVSKIGGTWLGVYRAGTGIVGMVARLWWRERRRPKPMKNPSSLSPSPFSSTRSHP